MTSEGVIRVEEFLHHFCRVVDASIVMSLDARGRNKFSWERRQMGVEEEEIAEGTRKLSTRARKTAHVQKKSRELIPSYEGIRDLLLPKIRSIV